LQIKEGTLHCNTLKLWESVNSWAAAAHREERKALRDAIRAGAALLLIKAEVSDGDWANTLAAHSTIHRSTAHRWMTNVNNLLNHCGVFIEPRAYQALINETADTYTAAVLQNINTFIDGKSATQLELSIRAPKKPLLPAPKAEEEDPAAVARREIGAALDKFREGLALLQHHRADLDDRSRAEVGYHCANHVQHMIPAGWQVIIRTHTGKEMTMQQVFAEHLGLPEAP
jgi:hypothetical protein